MISEKQKKIFLFSRSKFDALICDGAVRSGKTSIMVVNFVDWAMKNFDGQRFGICGKTVESAKKNIVEPYTRMHYANSKYDIRWIVSTKELIVKSKNSENVFEVFGGKDESSFMLIQGRTLAGVLLDEVVLMPRSFVEQALTRCSVEGAKFWFSCNPGSPTHWFYTEWILDRKEKNAMYIHFTMPDNPSLSEKTLKRYESIFKGVFYQRYVLGEWVLAEGLVYPNFDPEKNLFTDPPFLDEDGEPKAGTRFYISIDYGITNPFAAYLWAEYDDKAYCWKEYYYNGRKKKQRTDEEHYNAVEKLAEGVQISGIIIDPSASSFKQTVNRHGVYTCINANNDVTNGIAITSALIDNHMIMVHDSCTEMQKEFGLYSWDEKESKDEVIKENDHAMDSMRYFAYTVLRKDFYWMDWRRDKE